MGHVCAQIPVRAGSTRLPIQKWSSFAILLGVLAFQPETGSAQDGSGMNPPTIQDFVAIHLGGDEWELRGQVSDADPGALNVTFSGQVIGEAVTQEDGTFSFTFTLNSMAGGTVYAQVVGDEGLVATAETYIFNF